MSMAGSGAEMTKVSLGPKRKGQERNRGEAAVYSFSGLIGLKKITVILN